jgi:precorrin-2 dehydrogenase/sirohydrochlorin ferrochelatase
MLPLYVDISGKRIVVFGGGRVAERKIGQILEVEAIRDGGDIEVDVYGLDFTPWIEDKSRKSEIMCVKCNLWDQNLEELIEGAFLILVCTGDENLNTRILKTAAKSGILVNYRHEGDVFMSSVVKKGGFVISVSTLGKGPAMAKYMREKILLLIGNKEEKMLQVQSNIRRYLRENIEEQERRGEILNCVLNDPECWAALNKPVEVAEKLILKIIGDKYEYV